MGFRIQEVFRTGMNSASVFKVYEYHDPGKKAYLYRGPAVHSSGLINDRIMNIPYMY